MKRRYKLKPIKERSIAIQRIRLLFRLAEDKFHNEPDLSDRYVELARKISMKYKVRIPRELKRRFCKHCYSSLKPGRNLRIRIHKSRVIYYCLRCRNYMRFHKQ